MKRASLGVSIPGLVLMGLFNLLFFAIGDISEFTVSVWISYAFIQFAFLVWIATPFAISSKKDFARQSNVTYWFTLSYFSLAFLTGLVFIFTAPESEGGIKASWIIQVVWIGLFIIAFVPTLMANSHTNKELARQGTEARFLQDASSRIKLLSDRATDGRIITELNLLSSLISASPIKSSPEVKEIEIQMCIQISELEEAVDANDSEKVQALCKKITRGVKERNRILQLVSHG